MITLRILVLLGILMLISCFAGPKRSSASTTERGPHVLPLLMLFLNKNTNDPFTLITPYVNETDIKEIRSGFSTYKFAPLLPPPPWGYVHDGFDIYPNLDPTHPDIGLKPFQAVCSGRVDWIYTGDEQIIVWLTCDSTHTVEINFETQAAGTGQDQFANIAVTEGQIVSQGDLIGKHYAPNDKAHVHFSLYKNWITSCPKPYFTQVASDSMLNKIHVLYSSALMCYGDDPSPPPLTTPYVNKADMAGIRTGFSATDNASPWPGKHGGVDIYPQGDLKSFQVVCSGVIDTLELQQDSVDSNWKVKVLVQCDDYVVDPDDGGYFIPFSANYLFESMSSTQADGQAQLANISVIQGQQVAQGDIIGSLKIINGDSHVHFGLEMFASAFFAQFGAKSIPICPEPHFSAAASDSILDLLHAVWPNASMCYY